MHSRAGVPKGLLQRGAWIRGETGSPRRATHPPHLPAAVAEGVLEGGHGGLSMMLRGSGRWGPRGQRCSWQQGVTLTLDVPQII